MLSASRFTAGPSSPLEGVSNEAWRRFEAALKVQATGAISTSGGFGAYDMRPRRLVELRDGKGRPYATALRRSTGVGRQSQTCDFVLPWTQKRFLSDSIAQYAVFAKSISLYHRALLSGELKRPEGVSMAGALAILHIGGRGALAGWPKLFDATRARFEAARGAF
jgi:hypothetical protein